MVSVLFPDVPSRIFLFIVPYTFVKCQRMDPVAWNKKLDELSNKAPGYIDILEEAELNKFDFKGVSTRLLDNVINFTDYVEKVSCLCLTFI